MTAKILTLPGVQQADPPPGFDFATATQAEKAAFVAGVQSVIDTLGPVLPQLRRFAAQHGVALAPHLSAVS